MNKLRPTLTGGSNKYAPRGAEAYFALLQAIDDQPGLIHGKLHNYKGEHCTLGSYFDKHPEWAIDRNIGEEIAAINDCAPTVSPKRRKEIVKQWLKWKLRCYGFNYRAKKPRACK